MTSFLHSPDYSSLAVGTVGLATFAGLLGWGTVLLWSIRLQVPSPWSSVTAVLLGIQALSVFVQLVGISNGMSPFTLSMTWITLVGFGGAALLVRARHKNWVPTTSTIRAYAVFPVAIIGTAMLADFFIAVAPSTKIDELYYHMLVPSRIVADGAIHFYRMPWESAIWAQMAYQVASAPAHAIGYPDAANAVSWGLNAMLIWFAWRTIRTSPSAPSIAWTAFWVAGICVGMYPAVWNVTAGAHAMGDLAMAAAVVAIVERNRLVSNITGPAYAAMVSILLVSAATSKVTLVPACAILFCLSAWQLMNSTSEQTTCRVVLAFTAPWLIFYCPILLWTWIQSGSPFGPMLAGLFGPSIYDQSGIKEDVQQIVRWGQPPLITSAYYVFLNYSPLVGLGVIGAVWHTNLPTTTRATLALLFGLQFTLIYFLMPHDWRYLGGIHYGLLIVFASHAPRGLQNVLDSPRRAIAASAIFLLPWLGIQLYYAHQFFPVSFGFEKETFYRRFIAFYDDYKKLDTILPKDSVLLIKGYRLSSVYAPRAIFYDPLDVPPGKSVVLLSSRRPESMSPSPVSGYRMGEVVYSNPKAVVEVYRTPDRTPLTDSIRATRLYRE